MRKLRYPPPSPLPFRLSASPSGPRRRPGSSRRSLTLASIPEGHIGVLAEAHKLLNTAESGTSSATAYRRLASQ